MACGLLVLAALFVGGCERLTGQQRPQAPSLLTIGVPEGTIVSAALGAGQLASMLSVEGLTQANGDGRVVPRLAERWEWENGGLALRVFLRPNVRFHDGTQLTASVAADVLRRVIAQPGNRALYPSVANVTAVRPEGNLELVVELSQPSAFLLEDLSVALQLGRDIGTGPYRVIRRNGGDITLDRFE